MKINKFSTLKNLSQATKYWKQNIDALGYKLPMENQNSKKAVALKIYDALIQFRQLRKDIKFPKNKSFLVKLLIFTEASGFLYKFINDNKTIRNYINVETWKNNEYFNLINSIYIKDNYSDYIINSIIYSTIGPLLYVKKRSLFYLTTFTGLALAPILTVLNKKYEKIVEEKMNIEEFELFNQKNITPKLMFTTSVITVLNSFLENKKYKIKNQFVFMNRKLLLIFLYGFFISKFSKFVSRYTSESLK
jgi:hypothetical protein